MSLKECASKYIYKRANALRYSNCFFLMFNSNDCVRENDTNKIKRKKKELILNYTINIINS